MGLDNKTLAAAKSYVRQSMQGAGAIKGQKGDPGKDAPTITKVDVNESNVLLTTLSDGTTLTGGTIQTVSGKDGVDGKDGRDGQNGITPHIDPVTKHWFIDANDTGIVAEGENGINGLQGIRGEKGEQGERGIQGIQGIKGEKGDDGYPFLIYKDYETLSDFNPDDFPEIGLLFAITGEEGYRPVYRVTGESDKPYSFITNLSASEGIKGEKGDKGEQGIQGLPGQDGKDGTTYTPQIGTVNTLESNENASVSVSIDEENKTADFSFSIPKGEQGIQGVSGVDGTNGITPNIGENGNWWIGDIDTGEKATADPLDYADKKYGISDTPVGHVISHIGTIAPPHYLICDGATYNISDYPYLTQHFIDNFGTVNYFGGNGTTTFAVPDLRGEFLRGTGTNSHTYTYKGTTGNEGSGSDVGIHQGATLEPIVCNNVISSEISNGWIGTLAGDTNTELDSTENRKYDSAIGNSYGFYSGSNFYEIEGKDTIGTTRPTNTSVLYCIKYEPTYFIKVDKAVETANDLETTEQGFALDARQGKVLKDEIDTLNSINFGEVINIATTIGTTYTFENNGYLQVFADYGANTNICVLLNGIEIRVATGSSGAVSGNSQCVYVKKGMQIYVLSLTGNCRVSFIPLI